MSKRIGIGCLVVLLSGLAPRARADLTLYLENTTVSQGGPGVLNIYVSSPDPSADAFNFYEFQLQITGIGATAMSSRYLEFAANSGIVPQGTDSTPYTQTYDYLGASNYIFYQDSGDAQPPPPSIGGSATTSSAPNDTFNGIDYSNSLADHAPSKNTPTLGQSNNNVTLLASLLLYDSSGLEGDTYKVRVVDSGTQFFGSSGIVNYVLPSETDSPDYQGMVTIGSPGPVNAVPEPVSTITSLTGAFFFTVYGWLRLRSSRAGTAGLPPG